VGLAALRRSRAATLPTPASADSFKSSRHLEREFGGALPAIGAHTHLPLTPVLPLGLLRGPGASAEPSPHEAGDDRLRFPQDIDDHSRASSILEPGALRRPHVPVPLPGTMHGPPAAECVR
jgi:hypothetical protein